MPLPTHENRNFPVLQCSALPIISMPTVARRIEIKDAITTVRAREMLREAGVKALVASTGREIAAFGADEDLVRAFSTIDGKLVGTIELDLNKDSWARGLVYDAMARAISRRQPLIPLMRRKGHSIIVAAGSPTDSEETIAWRKERLSGLVQAYSTALVGKVPMHNYPFNEGIQLRLEQLVDRWWCVFEPFTYVEIPRLAKCSLVDGDNQDENAIELSWQSNPVMDWQRERWATRYNPTWAKIISSWAHVMAGQNGGVVQAISLRDESGLDAVFDLSPITAWSRPSHENDYFLRGGQ